MVANVVFVVCVCFFVVVFVVVVVVFCFSPPPPTPPSAPLTNNKVRRVTLQEVANQFSIRKASAHQILYEKLDISKVMARWVPKQRTEDQKSTVTIAKEHL